MRAHLVGFRARVIGRTPRRILALALAVGLAAAAANCNDGGNGPSPPTPPPPPPPPPAGNPLEQALGNPGALTMSGVVTTGLNPTAAQIRFRLQGTAFAPSPADISLSINGTSIPSSAISVTASEVTAVLQLDDGRNEVSFKAYDTIGRPLYLHETIWAGTNALRVNVVGSTGAPYLQQVTITLRLTDDPRIEVAGTSSAGSVTFQAVPSRTVLVEARAPNNLVGVAGGVGSDGVVTIQILGFAAASGVANNDLSLGLAGWNVGTSPVTIIAHVEGFPTAAPTAANAGDPPSLLGRKNLHAAMQRSMVRRSDPLQAATADNDLRLATLGEGPQSVSRTFSTSPGTTSAVVRYRFITTEIPGGYFGSEFNDYFSVSLRNSAGGTIANESSSMNALGLSAFDFASGATVWRTVTLQTAPQGEVVQLDVTVANVADGLLDSYIVIDFMAEKQEKVQPALAWNSTAGGLTLTYTVEGGPLQSEVAIGVYWASGTTYASRIGDAFFTHTVPAGTLTGPGSPIAIPGANLAGNPATTTHLLAAVSESKFGVLTDVSIAYGATANSADVSAGMIDVVKDGLRAAGQATVTVTSTARTPADQARAMFENLVNPAFPVQVNIANQRALYAAAGDAVVNVFAGLAANMSLLQINAASATIRAAMVAEINRQGPGSVSRHCADPTEISVIDVGGSSFNATNGPRFRTSVTPRVTTFIDEIATNNAYHLELRVQP